MVYYLADKRQISFSKFKEKNAEILLGNVSSKGNLVQIICYCLMPTHIHLTLTQLADKGISKFIGNILSSYSHYFNLKHNRKGPLWEGRFKGGLVKTDEQLLHLTRYIHLNPVSAYLVDKPGDWKYSSYKEYISKEHCKSSLCNYDNVLDIQPILYKKFVEDRISYQRELVKIKALIFD
ncbi:MAG: transposase [Candidatus Omnitrophota bacterium]